jgi:hypothetical protein
MFHDVKSPTRPTLISQGVGVSLTLTQRAIGEFCVLNFPYGKLKREIESQKDH